MKLLHVSVVAKRIENVKSTATIHNRYRDAIIFVRARGRGGRAAYLPANLFAKRFEKYAEEIAEHEIISQTNIENISNKLQKIKQKLTQRGGNRGGNVYFYLDSEKTIVCVENLHFVDADKGAAISGYKTAKDWRKTATRNEWEYIEIPVQGGYKKYYAVDSLPADARVRFNMELARIKANEAETKEKETGLYQLADEKDRQTADMRAHAITEWLAFRAKSSGKKYEKDAAFELQWNRQHPDFTLSVKSLHRWRKDYDERGLDGLVPRYSHQPKRRADFHPKAKSLIMDLYLDESRPRAYSVYQTAAAICAAEDWALPSFTTVDRFLKKLPKDLVARLRYGHKAFEDVFACIFRDINSIDPGQVYVGDGRMIDVSFGKGKKGQRIVIFPWMDVRTKRFLSAAFSANMNDAGAVTAGFYMAAKEHFPKDVIVDHGNDYLALSYSRKTERDLPNELTSPLEMLLGKSHVHLARIKNARTKIIERVFADMSGNFDKTLPGYTGMHIMDRPEKWVIEQKAGQFLEMDEIKRLVWQWMFEVYNNWKPGGKKSANEQWAEWFASHPARLVNEEKLRAALLPIRRAPRGDGSYLVRNNGIELRSGLWYWDEWMVQLPSDTRVFVRCEPIDEPDTIWLYDRDGKPLGAVPRNRFHGFDYLNEDPEKVSDFFKTRGDREKEILAYKKRISEGHGLKLTPELKQQRADIGRAPELQVDFETGEIIEPEPEYIDLDDIELPSSVDEMRDQILEAKKREKELEEKLQQAIKNTNKKDEGDVDDTFDRLAGQI